ncbi:MAG: CRISPR-associated endonuclease Cas1 [Saprospiraceae bacterium]|nr:CRISPR-associated endonuclease Cas1 [Saprospiraceae bacterium]
MHLFIEQYGVRLELEDGMLKISGTDGVRYASFLKLNSINILKNGIISTAVLGMAAEFEVPVMIYDATGRVDAWTWSHKYGSIALLRKSQVYYSDSKFEWNG